MLHKIVEVIGEVKLRKPGYPCNTCDAEIEHDRMFLVSLEGERDDYWACPDCAKKFDQSQKG